MAMKSPLAVHLEEWSNCKKCVLHETRKSVVQVRGVIPCNVLFIGEAPGESENVIGQPFIGPAGRLLDSIIEEAFEVFNEKITFALTNLVGCIPRADDGSKLKEPDKECIETCGSRLIQLTALAKPKLIVCVGNLAEEYLDKKYKKRIRVGDYIPQVKITHPSAILKGNFAAKPLAIKRQVVTLQNALIELLSCTLKN